MDLWLETLKVDKKFQLYPDRIPEPAVEAEEEAAEAEKTEEAKEETEKAVESKDEQETPEKAVEEKSEE